jgi:hypothetical protein
MYYNIVVTYDILQNKTISHFVIHYYCPLVLSMKLNKQKMKNMKVYFILNSAMRRFKLNDFVDQIGCCLAKKCTSSKFT